MEKSTHNSRFIPVMFFELQNPLLPHIPSLANATTEFFLILSTTTCYTLPNQSVKKPSPSHDHQSRTSATEQNKQKNLTPHTERARQTVNEKRIFLDGWPTKWEIHFLGSLISPYDQSLYSKSRQPALTSDKN